MAGPKAPLKLAHLRSFCAVVSEGCSISRASEGLRLSQPTVSKQIKALETSLGLELFVRTGNQFLRLTDAGQTLQDAARRTVLEADNFEQTRDEFVRRDSGRFVIGTTHVNARYLLRPFIKTFLERYPDVQLVLRQGFPEAIAGWVHRGDAHLGISATGRLPVEDGKDLVYIPFCRIERCVVAPPGHPVLEMKDLTLRDLAQFPIVTLDPATVGGRSVIKAFEDQGIRINTVLTALDADLVKLYVKLGLGVGIMPSAAYEAERDKALQMRDTRGMFSSTEISIMLRRGVFLRDYIVDFISSVSPHFDRENPPKEVSIKLG